jgi:hypothetical protein
MRGNGLTDREWLNVKRERERMRCERRKKEGKRKERYCHKHRKRERGKRDTVINIERGKEILS